ncbi:MAG TPA: hypothetical protein VJP89_06420 [Pyrinomonadaceae bacterium]|nr:hypothetical protein [Pyrinomonadaceae bacterium]
MNRLLALLLIALCFNFSLGAQKQRRRTRRNPAKPPAAKPTPTPTPVINDGWQPFTSETGRFTVLLPGTPTDKTEIVDSEPGPYTSHLYRLLDQGKVYLIAWVDYDPQFKFHGQSELEANRDWFVRDMNATLMNTRSLTLDRYPALEFRADTAEKTYFSRVYIVGRRPYQIAIGYPKGEDDPVTVGKFFNSFKVRLN